MARNGTKVSGCRGWENCTVPARNLINWLIRSGQSWKSKISNANALIPRCCRYWWRCNDKAAKKAANSRWTRTPAFAAIWSPHVYSFWASLLTWVDVSNSRYNQRRKFQNVNVKIIKFCSIKFKLKLNLNQNLNFSPTPNIHSNTRTKSFPWQPRRRFRGWAFCPSLSYRSGCWHQSCSK